MNDSKCLNVDGGTVKGGGRVEHSSGDTVDERTGLQKVRI
jgi:hypothetical protein